MKMFHKLAILYRNHKYIPHKISRSACSSAFDGKSRTFHGIVYLVNDKFFLVTLRVHIQVPLLLVHEGVSVNHVMFVLVFYQLALAHR